MTAVLTTDVLPIPHAVNLQSSFAIMINNIRLSERSICTQISKLLLTAIDEPARKIMCIFKEEIGELVRLRTVLSAMLCHVVMYRQTMKKTQVQLTKHWSVKILSHEANLNQKIKFITIYIKH